jgi:hypothetical protein
MTFRPLEKIRHALRSRALVLQWIGLLYRHPESIEELGKTLPPWRRVIAVLWIYLNALPDLILVGLFGRWLLLNVLGLEADRASFLNPARTESLWLHVPPLIGGLAVGLSIGLAVGIAIGLVVALAVGLSPGLSIGLMSSLAFGLVFGLTHGLTSSTGQLLAFSLFFGFACGLLGSIGSWFAGSLTPGLSGSLATGLTVGFRVFFAGDRVGSLVVSFVAIFAYFLTFFRLYYLPWHFLWLWPRAQADRYRLHPVAWDDVCLLPFPLFDRALVAFAERDPIAGEHEIERLIDSYPSQRRAALRARAILVARSAAELGDLSRLDETLARLPSGERGFLRQTKKFCELAHPITASQAKLDTLNRPFLREPYAALLVTDVEKFLQQSAGFQPPLSTELRKAARQWLVIARRELDAARAATTREPTRQVFRAGDPVDREREAFVVRAAILGELEQQVMLATGCPGLLLYGRRRMGKTTLLRNLEGLLPSQVKAVQISMQKASAFASLPDFINLISRSVAEVVPDMSGLATGLKGFEIFLNETQKRLEAGDLRLLLALDEYENLDRKIGEGVFSEDLLAVLRESIQTHRRIIWAFAGSHDIDELSNAPWTSYLVSARTLEVTPFEPAETRLLLTEPLKHSPLWSSLESERPRFEPGFWGAGGIQRIHTESGGWPNLVQLVAETVVDLVNDSSSPLVDEELLERALDRAVVRGNNFFFELIEKESKLPGELAYLNAFRTAEELSLPGDETMYRSLRRRRLVVEEGGRLRLRVPLIARWLRHRL